MRTSEPLERRQALAQFLLGFFALPTCALLGGMEALLFHWTRTRALLCVAFFAIFPLVGAIRTRQRVLVWGLVCGLVASCAVYAVLRP